MAEGCGYLNEFQNYSHTFYTKPFETYFSDLNRKLFDNCRDKNLSLVIEINAEFYRKGNLH